MFSLVKSTCYRLSQDLGLNALLRRSCRGRVLVLVYHGVLPDEILSNDYRDRNNIGLRTLRKQLEIAARYYRPITTAEVIEWAHGASTLSSPSMLVTFDDGLRNNITHAAAVLEELGIPALFNLPTTHIGNAELLWTHELLERIYHWTLATLPTPTGGKLRLTGNCAERSAATRTLVAFCKKMANKDRIAYLKQLRQLQGPIDISKERYAFMSWEEVADMQKRGFEIGSHSVTHPIMSRLDSDELVFELAQSKRDIEQHLGTECPAFTYPNGGREDVSDGVVSAACNAGYRIGFVIDGSFATATSDPLQLSRMSIPGSVSPTVFNGIVSGLSQIQRTFVG